MFSGGKMLMVRSEGPQLRTYYINFSVSLALDMIALVLLFLLYLSEKSNKKAEISKDSTESNSIAQSKNFLKVLFNFDHVKDTVKCLFKPREKRVRLQIFLLYIVLFITVITTTGVQVAAVQFNQIAYNWDVSTITTFSAVGQVLSMALLALTSAVLMKWLKLLDGTLILLSQASRFASDLISGVLIKPLAAYISIPVGSLSGIAVVSIRTKLSKLVSEEEVGKIFSLSSTIESLVRLFAVKVAQTLICLIVQQVPLVSGVIYSNIFTATIGSYPGMMYLFSCIIVFISMLIMLFERFYCPLQGAPNELMETKKEYNEI